MAKFTTSYTDTEGNDHVLQGDSVEEIATLVPEDYQGRILAVANDAGFIRGWVRGFKQWSAL